MATKSFYQTTRLKTNTSYTRQKIIIGLGKLIPYPEKLTTTLNALYQSGHLVKTWTNPIGARNLDCYLLTHQIDEHGKPL